MKRLKDILLISWVGLSWGMTVSFVSFTLSCVLDVFGWNFALNGKTLTFQSDLRLILVTCIMCGIIVTIYVFFLVLLSYAKTGKVVLATPFSAMVR